MKLRTALCDLLEIEYPILQSGMRRVAGPELAAEVSNAGGLGILAGLLAKGEDLRAQIRRVRELTDRPFGVNLWLHSELRLPVDPAALPQESVAAVQETLNVFRRRLGVAESTARPAPTPDTVDEAFEMILEERVPVWSTGLGEPDAGRIARCHKRGIRVIVMVGTRFVATKESQAAAFWKQAIVEARGDQTTITDVFSGLYARTIPNAFATGYEASGAPVLPSLLQSSTAQDVYAASAAQGNRDYFPLLAGQSSGLIHDLPGAAEVVRALVVETRSAIAAAAQRAGLELRAES